MLEQPVPGLYAELRTSALERKLAERLELAPRYEPIAPALVPEVLSRHVTAVISRRLSDLPAAEQQRLVNDLMQQYGTESDLIVALDELVSLHQPTELRSRRFERPHSPLSATSLLTNAPGERSIGYEVRSELLSADRVDLLCAFVKFAGVRVVKEPLLELAQHGIPIRILTTTYCGVTERRALDVLVREVGAQVKVCYDQQSTRLHAKAWLLKRDSGYDTGFVGSSNLSHSALVDGLEWNVRISAVATPTLVRKFEATFETYWNDPAFEAYDPDRDAARFDEAVRQPLSSSALDVSGLDVRARPHQELMLEALAAERTLHDRHRNLLIAATGTGKTVVAALDYRNLAQQLSHRPTLLFVAHRRELLEQALRTYREVLADGSFGEVLVGGDRPERWTHVFASVQSLARTDITRWGPRDFEVVVIDEFHHAAAPSYRHLLTHFAPTELLGLTATPERTDGLDVRGLFDGRAAYELRLWDALDQDLLCPFHYYGVADNTDLRNLEWRRGGYAIEGLDKVYTGNDARVRLVLAALHDRVADVQRMRAIGFCVSVAHAAYMARSFAEAGIASRAITGQTPREERDASLQMLRDGELQCLFAVDVFNEGVDIPSLDTIVMLRPTESATIFQQQLGRGLRRAPGKAVLTVLDFIGQQRREFRFADKLRVLTGDTPADIQRQVEEEFSRLPSGAQVILDEVSREIVLDNLRQAVRGMKSRLANELGQYGATGLTEFLVQSGRRLVDVYAKDGSWSELRRAAGVEMPAPRAGEADLLRRVHRLIHVDDLERAHAYRAICAADGPSADELDGRTRLYAAMLLGLLWPGWSGITELSEGLDRLRAQPVVCAEITELLLHTEDATRRLSVPLGGRLIGTPLFSHATYHRDEVLIATTWAQLQTNGRSPQGHATGVLWVEDLQTDVLFVTLRKDESQFSPQTMYRDYPVSLGRFHWESQNATSVESATGQRYLHHAERGSDVVLFTRVRRRDEVGTAPYVCLGRMRYSEHRGSRPISITWDLERPMPAEVFREANVAAS